MMHQRRRFWIELGAGAVAAIALLATLISREWIEAVFGVDPDHGSGSLEWAIVAVSAVVAVGCATLVPLEWRRTAPAEQ